MDSSNFNSANINFGARHIAKTKILKKASDKYLPREAHIVEFNFRNMNDKKTINILKEKWKDAKYTQMICSSYSNNRHVYALTTQKSNFRKLNPDSIMGLADIYLERKNASLKFLQVNPKYINKKDSQAKGIGKSLMHGIVNKLKKQKCEYIDLYALPNIKPFYRKIFPKILDKLSTKESYTNMVLEI